MFDLSVLGCVQAIHESMFDKRAGTVKCVQAIHESMFDLSVLGL